MRMRTIKGNTHSESATFPPAAFPASISLPRTRVKLGALVVLATASAMSDSSHWGTLAIALTCLAVPLAVTALGGMHLLRALFFIATPPLPARTIPIDEPPG
jgi:hypothetical protein